MQHRKKMSEGKQLKLNGQLLAQTWGPVSHIATGLETYSSIYSQDGKKIITTHSQYPRQTRRFDIFGMLLGKVPAVRMTPCNKFLWDQLKIFKTQRKNIICQEGKAQLL